METGDVREGRDGAAEIGWDGVAGVADEECEVESFEEGERNNGWIAGFRFRGVGIGWS